MFERNITYCCKKYWKAELQKVIKLIEEKREGKKKYRKSKSEN